MEKGLKENGMNEVMIKVHSLSLHTLIYAHIFTCKETAFLPYTRLLWQFSLHHHHRRHHRIFSSLLCSAQVSYSVPSFFQNYKSICKFLSLVLTLYNQNICWLYYYYYYVDHKKPTAEIIQL